MQRTAGSQRLELLVPCVENYGLPLQGSAVSCFAYWPGTQSFVLLIGPVHNALFCLLVRYRMLCFASWSGIGRFSFAYWSGTQRFVLLIGPVQNALFCFMVRYRTFCFAYWSGTQRFVLLIGPVQNSLFRLMVRYGTFCFAYWSATGRLCYLLNGPVQNAFFG